MVGRGRGRGRGNQAQQTELAEMCPMIEDLSRAVQALQRQEPAVAIIWRIQRATVIPSTCRKMVARMILMT